MRDIYGRPDPPRPPPQPRHPPFGDLPLRLPGGVQRRGRRPTAPAPQEVRPGTPEMPLGSLIRTYLFPGRWSGPGAPDPSGAPLHRVLSPACPPFWRSESRHPGPWVAGQGPGGPDSDRMVPSSQRVRSQGQDLRTCPWDLDRQQPCSPLRLLCVKEADCLGNYIDRFPQNT